MTHKSIPRRYRLARGLIRLWLAVRFRSVRFLHGEVVPRAAACLLVVGRTPAFRDALVLVAAFERPVRSILPRSLLQSSFRRLLSRVLGMVAYDPDARDSAAIINACYELLAKREAVAIFAEPPSASREADPSWLPVTVATEAERRHSGRLGLTLFAVHWFVPEKVSGARSRSRESLIYIDDPIRVQEFLAPDAASREAGTALAARLAKACQENAFRLEARELSYLLSDLTSVLRAEFIERWACRPNSKQPAEGLELSRFVAEWAQRINYVDPGRLVALGGLVEEHREGRRRRSLWQLEIEAAGNALSTRWGRAGVWFETVLGLPVAAYALVNHLAIIGLLRWSGLLQKTVERASKVDWFLRALVVLACYSGQVLLCAHWLGRRAAAFYAPSLPLTGAYLWRYHWLLRRRTRQALAAFRSPAEVRDVARLRKAVIRELDRALGSGAERSGAEQSDRVMGTASSP